MNPVRSQNIILNSYTVKTVDDVLVVSNRAKNNFTQRNEKQSKYHFIKLFFAYDF